MVLEEMVCVQIPNKEAGGGDFLHVEVARL